MISLRIDRVFFVSPGAPDKGCEVEESSLRSKIPSIPALSRAAVWLLCLGLSSLTATALHAADDQRLPGLSGYWRLKDKGTSTPVLTSAAKAEMNKPDRKGDVDLESDRWCIFQGMPYVMDSAGPIEIRQSVGETIIIAERLAVPRHIYFKLDERPSADVYDFTPVGLSTGQREGDSLVVTTDMFTAGLGLDGAPRTEKAKLVERFNVSKNGKELVIASTWTDPDVYKEPYRYSWTYERIPENYTASPNYCDPRANGVGNYPPGEDPRPGKSGN